jgi:uncharacterized protein YjbJ (UPF0337 family)
MSGKSDQIKGRIKEAFGALRGDAKLKSEGRHDQQAGEAKSKVARAEDKVEQGIDKARDSIDNALDAVKKAVHPPE